MVKARVWFMDARARRILESTAIKGKDVEAQIYGGVENGIGTAEYDLREVPLDRSRGAPGFIRRSERRSSSSCMPEIIPWPA